MVRRQLLKYNFAENMKKALIAIIIVLTAPVFLYAEDNTFLGPTGYINIPTAKVLEKKIFNLGMWVDSDYTSTMNFECGLGKGIEVGLCEEITKDGATKVALNYNWLLLEEKQKIPCVSWGSRDKWNYLVLTKGINILKGGSVSFGIGTENFDRYPVFAGLKVIISEKWYAAIDYDGSNMNIGLRMPYIGLLGLSIPGSSDIKGGKILWGYPYQLDLKEIIK